MEGSGSCSKREGKRRLDEGDDDDFGHGRAPKQQKTPDFGRVVLKALKMEIREKMSSYFEPLIRKIFREQMQQCFGDLGKLRLLIHEILYQELQSSRFPDNLPGGIRESGGRELQLRFETKMADHLFAGKKVEGEGGSPIKVVLIDLTEGSVIKTGPESTAKLNILVLQGDFDEDFRDGWTHETFKSHQVKERDGKGPILIGDIQVTLKDGVGILGDLSFTDNSSWTRTKKFRLGVELAPGCCEGTSVMEAKTEAFSVLDQRGEAYRKHYPPALQDEVYRLKGIAKGKPLHDKLVEAGIITVEDLLRFHAKDPRKLRNMLGTGMTDKKWKSTIDHAKTCDFSGGKCCVFYTDISQSSGVVFNHIHELKGRITDGKFLPLESPAQTKEVSYLVKKAYENWKEVMEYDDHVLQSFTTIQQNQSDNMSEWPQFRFVPVKANQTHMEEPFISSESFNECSKHATGENNGQGLENSWDDETMRELQSIFPNVGFIDSSMPLMGETSGAGCSYSFEDPLHSNDEMLGMGGLVDVEMENTEFDLGSRLGEEMGLAAIFGYSNEARASYDKEADPQYDEQFFEQFDEQFEDDPVKVDNGMNRGRAVIGWLKIKVALRWGIMMRKRAAERRVQLAELD